MAENHPSDKSSPTEAAAERGGKRVLPWIVPRRRPGARTGMLLWVVLKVAFWYLVIVVMLGVFQRSLIYFPMRDAKITPADAGLLAGRVHTITLETHDGLELRGWHVLADGHQAETSREADRELATGRLLVLYFSGNAGNRRYRMLEFEIFTGSGADLFVFDYRGYGDNPGSPNETALTADARAAWNYATEDRKIPPEQIVLFGESLGGAVATRLAAEVSKAGTPPAGLVLRAPFSSLPDVGAWHYPWLPVRLALLDRYPAVKHMPAVRCPLLIIHGSRDRIVPIELGRKLYEAAPDQSADGIPKRFVTLRGADHNDVLFAAREEYRQAIREFFAALERR